ncbi:hypothetical protein [Actinomadura macrotermitis]|nr:hypothetical protein [Actinomadura macrotermitis]
MGSWQKAEPVLNEIAGHAGEVGSGRRTNLLSRAAERIARADARPQ